MADRDPNLLHSSLSGNMTRDGITIDVQIYKVENVPGWALEVINHNGTSTVWDDLFETDDAAHSAFIATISEEGIETFLDSATVIPFRR